MPPTLSLPRDAPAALRRVVTCALLPRRVRFAPRQRGGYAGLMVVYVVRDLLFVSKIREAAEGVGVAVEGVRDVESLPGAARNARLVILDLGLPQAMRALELLAGDPATAGIPSVGFVGHERTDVMETARALGCGRVMAKGELAAKLGALLREAGA